MEKLQITVPAMFGDHHVLAVRNILLAIDGVADVVASAAWRTVEVTYDPAKLSPEQIERRLDEEGYTHPAEAPVLDPNAERTRRYSSTLIAAVKTIGFAQKIAPVADTRPLYPCPGMMPWRDNANVVDEA
ncbi:MAG: heavy-metal-associated domain-containing protein [Anaerolineae bacterium]|nr:heavy-metal-associated domain-containing protein [Anaerolineae bacterium]